MDTKQIFKSTREKGQIIYHWTAVKWIAGNSAAILARTP